MVTRVHGLRDYVQGNTQSCADLVNYLYKENEGKNVKEQEFFFNSQGKAFRDLEVIERIDNNKKGLKKDEAKFFMVSINPSQRELKYMSLLATGRDITEVSQMTKEEQVKFNSLFKEYVNDCMELYAQRFNKGLTRDDILYFAKIEQERTFKSNDKEVKDGMAKSGEKKPGLQTHAHIVVSRKDRDMKYSISPLANSRGDSQKHQLNGKSVQVGFDREQFKIECETLFDVKFDYQRGSDEYYLNAKANKYAQTVTHAQYSSYIRQYQSLAEFKGNVKDNTGSQEAKQFAQLANAAITGNINGIVRGIESQMKGIHASEFNKVSTGQFLNIARNIASGNPITATKEILKIISRGMEI